MSLADRLREGMAEKGLNQSQLAKLVGVTKASVSLWLSSATQELKGENLVRAAKVLGVTESWLQQGSLPKHHKSALQAPYPATKSGTARLDNNVSPPEPSHRRVPLISWVQAGQFCPIIDNFEAGTAEQWVASPRHVGPQAFALEVHGDSMADEFREGDIIIVDPDQEARSGDMVVVRNGDAEATFKKLTKDGNDWWLTPLNRQYAAKLMPKDAVICGRVMAKIPKPAFY
ncbi:S24 family peptidase [Acidithiobacillus sp.]|uniref:S24 family peptidase n=1 Tax=Acidithiobacillus sp. TaxID=1872118 RepID=UPI00356A0000